MSDTTLPCPTCGAQNQLAGKYCEQCGTMVAAPSADEPPQTGNIPPVTPASSDEARFVLLVNGAPDPSRGFTVAPGRRLLVGRTDLSSDPASRTIPDVDVTPWATRVQTPDGALYSIHRRQCYISYDDGVLRIVDYPSYVGDTLVSPAGSHDFKTIPALAQERPADAEGAVELRPGDRIVMGQGEGALVFQVVGAQSSGS